MSNKILIVAGEVSGDLHAAPVVAELKRLDPTLTFVGAGGDLLREQDVKLLATVRELAVMGFSGIPKVLPRLAELKKDIIHHVVVDDIKLAILTDYPGFNLNLAQALKALPNPPKVLYYIAPQLWAWRPGRAELIKQYVDKLAVVFRFEIDFFRKWDVEPVFVGHPLLDELHRYLSEPRVIASPPLLALLPGSRPSVAKRHVSIMLDAAASLKKKIPNLRIAVGLSPALKEWWKNNHAKVDVEYWDDARALLRQATAAAVCSGTATLEAALMGAPQVVIYRTSFLNYAIARRFVTIPRVSLVNVITGREVVRELIQFDFTARRLEQELEPLLIDPESPQRIKEGYEIVQRALGDKGASTRVAQLAMEMLQA